LIGKKQLESHGSVDCIVGEPGEAATRFKAACSGLAQSLFDGRQRRLVVEQPLPASCLNLGVLSVLSASLLFTRTKKEGGFRAKIAKDAKVFGGGTGQSFSAFCLNLGGLGVLSASTFFARTKKTGGFRAKIAKDAKGFGGGTGQSLPASCLNLGVLSVLGASPFFARTKKNGGFRAKVAKNAKGFGGGTGQPFSASCLFLGVLSVLSASPSFAIVAYEHTCSKFHVLCRRGEVIGAEG